MQLGATQTNGLKKIAGLRMVRRPDQIKKARHEVTGLFNLGGVTAWMSTLPHSDFDRAAKLGESQDRLELLKRRAASGFDERARKALSHAQAEGRSAP